MQRSKDCRNWYITALSAMTPETWKSGTGILSETEHEEVACKIAFSRKRLDKNSWNNGNINETVNLK